MKTREQKRTRAERRNRWRVAVRRRLRAIYCPKQTRARRRKDHRLFWDAIRKHGVAVIEVNVGDSSVPNSGACGGGAWTP
jgi:hypothetical protein